MQSSPRFRSTDSRGEENSTYPCYSRSSPSTAKLRLMCSTGGHIVPRAHDKSLCYVGGDTRMVAVDRHITLLDLTRRLSKTLLRSTATSPPASSFTLKYQLPSEDLDSLISVTTDEDLENMIEECERLNSSSRLRLFIFPTNPESVSSIGSFLENPTKSDDWFLNALNGTISGFSDTSSVNCLLDLDDEISLPEKKDVSLKLRGNNSGQDVHSIPDSGQETTSSFGSASSNANLPPIRVNADDRSKIVGGGIEDQFFQLSVESGHHKQHDDGGLTGPMAVSGSPVSSSAAILEHSGPFLSDHERSEQGLQMAYVKQQQQQRQPQLQQQKQSTSFDLASGDSITSDLTITHQSSPVSQISFNNQPAADPNDTHDQDTRIQMLQQQKFHNPAYLTSMPTTQVESESPRHQLHHQQPQYIPPLQYIRHPSVAVPVTSYYQHHPHPHHPPMDQQNFMYYIPTRQPPQGYSFPRQQPQPSHFDTPPAAATKTELPAGVYRTTSSSGAPQLVRIPSGYQNQPQHVEYSEIHQPTHSIYYATPLSNTQYQKMTSIAPVEARTAQQ